MEQAARELGFQAAESFVIGDKPCDIDLGRQLGAVTILVRTGYGAEWARRGGVAADHVVDDLAQAADVIQSLWQRA